MEKKFAFDNTKSTTFPNGDPSWYILGISKLYSPRLKKKFAFHVYIYTAIYSFPPSPYIRFYRFNKGWFEGVCEKCSRMLFSMRKEFLNVDVYEIIEKRVQSHYFRSYFRAHYERNPHYYDSVLMHV